MPHTIRKKIEAFQWFGFIPEERFKHHLPITYEEYAEKIQVSTRQLSNWKAEYDKVQSEKKTVGVDDYTPGDWKQYLQSKKLEAAKRLVEEVQNGKVTAIEAFFKLLGEFIEKTEHKVEFGLTADEIARRNFEADRQLREGGYRVAEVSEKPSLLPEQVCVDNQQEHRADS